MRTGLRDILFTFVTDTVKFKFLFYANKIKKTGKNDVFLRTVLSSIDIVPTGRKRTENVFTLSVLFS